TGVWEEAGSAIDSRAETQEFVPAPVTQPGTGIVPTVAPPGRPARPTTVKVKDGKIPDPATGWPTLLDYEILEDLGHGGMGVVYRARQLSLNRLVAIKMILAGAQADPHKLHRFYFEAEAVASLQHPNIVQIYEVAQQEGRPYFALEFIDGGSLDKKLDGAPL